VCELLKTVSLLKSDITNDKTRHKKLITTKKNCKNVNDKILVSNTFEFLNFLQKNKKN
jgi:predicted nicotinamide N-methyase